MNWKKRKTRIREPEIDMACIPAGFRGLLGNFEQAFYLNRLCLQPKKIIR
jgi:hypothetical protein